MNRILLTLTAALAVIVAACGFNSATPSPTLSDPKAIVQAGLDAAQTATSVHLDVHVDGTAKVSLPGSGVAAGSGTPVKLDGTTASIDVDFAKPAAHATIAVPALFNFTADLIAIDGKSYLKSSLTGPLYQVQQGSGPVDPGSTRGLFQAIGTAIQQPGVVLTKGADVQCGSETCYTITTKLTAEQLGTATGALGGLPIDLAGATVDLTVLVEQADPNHLAGIKAVITTPDGNALTVDVAASKWNQPVTISAPAPDQVKPS
jgi:LppX/LprAFG-like lipoprotein